jgi:hypothetical protein
MLLNQGAIMAIVLFGGTLAFVLGVVLIALYIARFADICGGRSQSGKSATKTIHRGANPAHT